MLGFHGHTSKHEYRATEQIASSLVVYGRHRGEPHLPVFPKSGPGFLLNKGPSTTLHSFQGMSFGMHLFDVHVDSLGPGGAQSAGRGVLDHGLLPGRFELQARRS